MSKATFYKDLPYVERFKDLANPRLGRDVPIDWYVLVTDIAGSTIAVEEGKYKEVNFVAACTITAILNLNKNLDLPFVFGGDGATILIPPELLEKAKDTLLDTMHLARDEFGFNMRVGFVPVLDVLRQRQKIKIIKLKVAENYYQSVFLGGGVEVAENLVKKYKKYHVKDVPPKYRAKFDGLKCLWQDIPSRKEEVVSLLIKATSLTKDHTEVYEEVMDKIQEIYGDKNSRYPVQQNRIKIGNGFKKVYLESTAEAYQYKKNKRNLFLKNYTNAILKSISDFFVNKLNRLNSKVFKKTVIHSIDSEKFDDMLRMIIAGTRDQRIRLKRYLERSYKNGDLAYGLKQTKSVLVTCLIYRRRGNQVHFIDGANGGYTFAAKEFKNRIKWQKIYMQTY